MNQQTTAPQRIDSKPIDYSLIQAAGEPGSPERVAATIALLAAATVEIDIGEDR